MARADYEKEDEHQFEDKDKLTIEQVGEEIKAGERAEDVYSEEGREKLVDDDEIEPWEEAFMEGAEGRGGQTSCRQCGRLLSTNKANVVERKIGTDDLWFCCNECAEKFMERRGKKLLE